MEPQTLTEASVAGIEHLVDGLARSLSKRTIAKFAKFSELPLELRRLVFLYSLPSETRILPVELTLREADEEFGLCFTFALSPIQQPLRANAAADPLDIALLSACRESREVYLENNKHILPAGFKSVIRYNPKNTMVLIQNFQDLQRTWQFAEGIEKGCHKQRWFSEIKQLAVPIWAFLVDLEAVELIWGDDGHGDMMSAFENVEVWTGVVFPGDLCGGREDIQRGHLEIMADVVQHELLSYRRLSNPDYKVPVVEVLEIIECNDSNT
ncbi:hypothetical protein ONS95_010057 [Cadophora gregata]|uniref:uncharacterized protein n=1 Tax=Cadophora gregata TaxID=51156 RepID=UPI0026DA94C7|nr:uncharacterized protein ONS95_010057 [Cadophora gregata]KAK0121771.1 hypothetical protein ONS95_010057 [Cadophora gregata]